MAVLAAVALVASSLAVTLAVPRLAGTARAAVPSGSPYGGINYVAEEPNGLRYIGWAIDPNTTASISVYVTIDGRTVGTAVASKPRADVAKLHPQAGPNHGFDLTVPAPRPGTHTACVYARNVGAGANTMLRCQSLLLGGPVGSLSVAAQPGHVAVSGWAIDYDAPQSPVSIAVAIDGQPTTLVANQASSAAAAWLPSAGSAHGFSSSLPLAQGRHQVCVTFVNIGPGVNRPVTCRTITLAESPLGYLEPVARTGDQLRVRGWAYDPDSPTTRLSVRISIDGGTARTVLAGVARPDVARAYPQAGQYHGYELLYALPEGVHTFCVTAVNLSYGSDSSLGCRSGTLRFTPTAGVTALTPTAVGAVFTGWATDPDTTAAISVYITVDGRIVTTVPANLAGGAHSGHAFLARLQIGSGTHTVCAIGRNVVYGTHNSTPACNTVSLVLGPFGRWNSLTRAAGSNNLQVTGWTFDPDTTAPISVAITLDGQAAGTVVASAVRSDIASAYPASGAGHGISTVVPADAGEHTVCLTALNVGLGSNTALGCQLIIAVHPVAPSAPQAVTAQAGYGGATVTWQPPASDGGAPWTKYVVTASAGGATVTVPATATSATVLGLRASANYAFSVQAYNVAGASALAWSAVVKTQASPPPQTTPAPVSTSRYIRNIRGSSTTDLTTMRNEGATDAYYNPSGHGYLVLLDIGGQDHYDGGVVLSATTRFVSYADLVKDLEAYVDGYYSRQRPSAPVWIALGTNNDMDVSSTTGAEWARYVVNPVRSYAARYPGITIAGANDIEPGFRSTYSQTRSWLQGYLAATSAPFVFNGSADGCSWTTTGRACNNGWSMNGLYYLTVGAAPTRMLNLPQIYNTTMAAQWKYISLTGVVVGNPRINFAGTLTEWTACDQAGGCGSLTGHTAWSTLWADLQSDARLRISSLPYSTDLRIDK